MTKHLNTPWLHSKTSYMRGRQCIKSMYLHRFKRYEKTKDSENASRIKNKGYSFEKQFHKLHFPKGIGLKQAYGDDLNKNLIKTGEILSEQASCTIFEAALVANETFVSLDVLHKNTNGNIDIYELKNSSKIKASFIWDAALQYFVCKSIFGQNLNSINLVLKGRNNSYKIIDVSKQTEKKQTEIQKNLKQFSEILNGSKAPGISMGKHCKIPYECDFKEYCRKTSNN